MRAHTGNCPRAGRRQRHAYPVCGGWLQRSSTAVQAEHVGANQEAIGYEINDEYLEKCRELAVHAVKCDLRVDKPPWERSEAWCHQR